MAYERIRIEFLLDEDEYFIESAIKAVRSFIFDNYSPTSVHDTDCGVVPSSELEYEWGFAPGEADEED